MTTSRIPDVPLFRSTEEAMEYGRGLRRVLEPDEFQTLVRTWMASSLACTEAPDQRAKILLATRCQLLREAIQEVLFPDGMKLTQRADPALLEVGGS